MLLQNTVIDGTTVQVNSHGHHHRQHPATPREEVVLCAVYHFPEPTEAIRRLQVKFPHVRFIWHTLKERWPVVDDGEIIPKADYRDATVYLTFTHSPSSLSFMPNLRLVQLLTSGHDHMRNTSLLSNPSIPVSTCSGVSARSIAQYVVLSILSWAHQYPKVFKVMSEKKWAGPGNGERGYPKANILAGKRVGIWGYGSIGRQAGRILHAMGMHIIACTSSEKSTPESRRLRNDTNPFNIDASMGDDEGRLPVEWHSGATKAGLDKFLSSDLDILAIFTPLTLSTRHALGKDQFDVLTHNGTRHPFLVNVSRGPIIVQDELVAALKDGRLSGAALDVTDPEPLPEDHEMWNMPNVSITPHMSWCFEEYVADCLGGVLEENLRRLETNKRLVNQIQ
ncbi:hypothetical protein N0V82_002167 [Gnomoniopsis sp. IMI 355080]|nr:hypothetical protein N0V82_002167 [Gnomoniopsis sp. IMI 355080]